MNRVSIIVPVYNVEKYIVDCIDSLLEQTYKNFEIIFIDDGSTDNSSSIINEKIKYENKCKYVYKENGGLSSARNLGIKTAVGDYICFIDSDDWIEKDYIKKLVEKLEKTNADICGCGYQRITDNQKVIQTVVSNNREYSLPTEIVQIYTDTFIEAKYGIIACNKIFKKELLVKNKLFFEKNTEIYAEDVLFNTKLLYHATKIVYIPDVLYNYRVREGSITESKKEQLTERYCNLFNRLVEFDRNKKTENSEYLLAYVSYEILNVITADAYKYNNDFSNIHKEVVTFLSHTNNGFEVLKNISKLDKYSKIKRKDIFIYRKILFILTKTNNYRFLSLLFFMKQKTIGGRK